MTKKVEQKSILQSQAADLRQLMKTIEEYTQIEKVLALDAQELDIKLMQAQANLRDTRLLLQAQKEKLAADAGNMHQLIENAVKKVGAYHPF